MNRQELYKKASELPYSPGVYIMKNRQDRVIYVGKSKVLRQRVSQYFADVCHNTKTEKMVSNVYDFDYILTDTEMEALALENKLIKHHSPKYNIKLKDAKSYPYIKLNLKREYPVITVDRKRSDDGCRYFGPYSSINTAYSILHTVQRTFRIPNCKRSFPDDIGKERPCLYKQMGQCCAPCDGSISSEEFRKIFTDVVPFLNGRFGETKKQLEERMRKASDNMQFENAAVLRDRIIAVDKLLERQKAVSGPGDNLDVFALYSEERCSCLNVFYIRSGFVSDSEFHIFNHDQIDDMDSVTDFICGIYSGREFVPKTVVLGFRPGDDNTAVLKAFLEEKRKGCDVLFPEKGKMRNLCEMVRENAKLHAEQYISRTERDDSVLIRLASLLSLEVVSAKIEAYDISNMGNDAIVAGKISVAGSKFVKDEYRSYNIKGTDGQDDYASMSEALRRRLRHSEEQYPDLILLDGGKTHVSAVKKVLEEEGADIPVFGMVKDDYHKTRALTDESSEIGIAREPEVYNFIYRIQEEIHRFTIGRMRSKRSAGIKRSSLESISGIGPAKAKKLLASFKTIENIKKASAAELAETKGISVSDAESIAQYFAEKAKGQKP